MIAVESSLMSREGEISGSDNQLYNDVVRVDWNKQLLSEYWDSVLNKSLFASLPILASLFISVMPMNEPETRQLYKDSTLYSTDSALLAFRVFLVLNLVVLVYALFSKAAWSTKLLAVAIIAFALSYLAIGISAIPLFVLASGVYLWTSSSWAKPRFTRLKL